MIKVQVRFRGPLANQLENPIIELKLEDGTVLRRLFELILQEDERVRSFWENPDQIDRDALVLCNDIDIGLSGGLESILTEGDSIVILPLIHGG